MIIFYCLLGSMILTALGFVLAPTVRQAHINKTPLVIIIMLPLFVVLFYINQTSFKQFTGLLHAQQQLAAAQKLRAQLGSPDAIIAKLQQTLQQHPNSAQGWFLLGKIYFDQQSFSKAVSAFEKAYALQPNNPDILFYYAENLYLRDHSLAGKPQQLLQKLLQLQPNNDLAINLLAVAAFNEKNYPLAIRYWEKILPHYSANSPDGKAILEALANAQTALAKLQKRNIKL